MARWIGPALLSLLSLLCLLCCCPAWAATYHVDASVAVSGDGSAGSPWKRLSNITGLQPGDTVLFKRGEVFDETLSPTSGIAGKPVTYAAYGTGALPSIRRLAATGRQHVVVKELELHNDSSGGAVELVGSSYFTFEACQISTGPANCTWTTLSLAGSNHNRLRGCTVENRCTTKQNDTLGIRQGSSYNLVEGCTLKNGTHSTLALDGGPDSKLVQRYNIIRQNSIISAEGRPLEIMTLSDHNLVEGNLVVGGKYTNLCIGGQNFKLVTSRNIVRRNVFRDSYQSSEVGLGINVYQYQSHPANQAEDNRIYHNTFTGLHGPAIAIRTSQPGTCAARRNVFKNNLLAANPGSRDLWVENEFAGISDNFFAGNLFYRPAAKAIIRTHGNTYDVAGAQAAYPAELTDNLEADPRFQSPQSKDFSLQPGSPAIDAGVFLTRTSGAGSGIKLTVEDASFFSNGWGLIEGDRIQLEGQLQPAQVTGIEGNTLLLSTALTWDKGKGVALVYADAAPDIGAFEHGEAPLPSDRGAGLADAGGKVGDAGDGGQPGSVDTGRPSGQSDFGAASSDGCSCRLGADQAPSGALPLALLLLLLLPAAGRRRRRRLT